MMMATLTGSDWSDDFESSYTAKDLIQYALSVGCCSDNNDSEELKYVYELHPQFEALPSFCFVLPAWAAQSSSGEEESSSHEGFQTHIQSFPTPLMLHMGVIPKECLNDAGDDVSSHPIIHIHQSATFHAKVPIPSIQKRNPSSRVKVRVSSRVLSVLPKSVGTFVTSSTRIRLPSGSLISSMTSTVLVLGMDADRILPFKSGMRIPRKVKVPSLLPTFEWIYHTSPDQALLYRTTSGDFNPIHVDASLTSSMMGSNNSTPNQKPILHGLCTMAIALRGMQQRIPGMDILSIQTQFTKPVFVGDSLKLEAWVEETRFVILFRVMNLRTNEVVLDGGEIVFRATGAGALAGRSSL